MMLPPLAMPYKQDIFHTSRKIDLWYKVIPVKALHKTIIYSHTLYVWFFLAISILFITSTTGIAAGYDAMYLNNLITTSHHLKLSEQHYWDLLLHYRPVNGGRESMVDDSRFFLSKNGKTDPKTEIEATLTGFFAEPFEDNEHVRCRFVARYAWLKEQLQIDESRLPIVACHDFEQTISNINPRSVVLIFPVSYINNPASMFGHTFLRIDGGYDSTLISTAVNYAAITEDSMGVAYALKGISGGFRGYYYTLPYHEKIREYTAIDYRDIWEYNLDLTEKEARRIVLHIWEMRDIYSEYYFFDENCSFAALYLLEIARPSLRLIEGTNRLLVLPISTVKAVVDTGIVTQVAYRPSQGTRIRKISGALSVGSQRLAHGIATGTTDVTVLASAGMQENEWIMTLDLASEYIRYLASRRIINSEEYLSRFQIVMQERSRFGRPSDKLFESAPIRPDKSHPPGRIGIGGGCRTDSCFSEINLRLGYHDFLDNGDGYVENTQIDFMHVFFRYDLNERNIKLHSLRILDIASITPQDMFFSSLSWRATLGVDRKNVPSGEERLVTDFNIGAGFSALIGKAITYTLAEIELNVSRSFDNGATFGAGGSAGILMPLTPRWKIHSSVRSIVPFLGTPYRILRGEIAQNFTISKNRSVSATIYREKINGHDKSEVKVKWNIYF